MHSSYTHMQQSQQQIYTHTAYTHTCLPEKFENLHLHTATRTIEASIVYKTLDGVAQHKNIMNFKPSARQVLALMVFWGQIQNYMMRVNLSILIVAMVKDTQTTQLNSTAAENSSYNLTCMENRAYNMSNPPQRNPDHHEGFDWNELRRGQVLGAFSIGYITTQVKFSMLH